MGDWLESAKNKFSSAVSRTSWEAQKRLKLHGKQSEIDNLLDQRFKLLEDLSQTALNLYVQGALTDSQLARISASIIELDNDVKKREGQLEELKQEKYPEDQLAPGQPTNYTPPPASNQQPGSGNQQPGTGYSGSQPGYTGTGYVKCPNCGTSIRSNAAYCRSCGAKIQ